MNNKIHHMEEIELRYDKAPIFFTGLVCVSLGFQLHLYVSAVDGFQLPNFPKEDDMIQGFLITGLMLYMVAFLLVLVSFLKQTVHHRAALTLCVFCLFIGVAFSVAGMSIYGTYTIDPKYNPGGFQEEYQLTMYICASTLCLIGGIAIMIDLCKS